MNSEVDCAPNRRFTILATVAMALALVAAVVWWPGCRQYPPLQSQESLRVLELLNSACNTKNSSLLAEAESRLAKIEASGNLGAAEKKVFESIINLGKAGEWKRAEAKALSMASDQVNRQR